VQRPVQPAVRAQSSIQPAGFAALGAFVPDIFFYFGSDRVIILATSVRVCTVTIEVQTRSGRVPFGLLFETFVPLLCGVASNEWTR
jgi:hypothetical protein